MLQIKVHQRSGFFFLENEDFLKDCVAKENMSIIPYALEWGNALVNLQQQLRNHGVNSGLPFDHWE